MTPAQKKHIKFQAMLSFLINGAGNGLIAYFLNRNKQMEQTPMSQNVIDLAFDIGITFFLLAWLIAWSMNAGVKKAGFYGVTEPQTKLQAWMGERFKKPATFGWLLCIGMVPLFYGLTLWGIQVFNITYFTLWGFIMFKSSYTAVVGTIFAILFIISAFYVRSRPA